MAHRKIPQSLQPPLPGQPGGNEFPANRSLHNSSPHPRNGVCPPRAGSLYRNDAFIERGEHHSIDPHAEAGAYFCNGVRRLSEIPGGESASSLPRPLLGLAKLDRSRPAISPTLLHDA